MRTILMLPFEESASTAPIGDAAEQLSPLVVDGTGMPESVDAWTGRGRDFVADDSEGVAATDADDGLTLAVRDCSIEWLGTIRSSSGAPWPRCIIARGKSGSAAERVNYRLELHLLAVPANPVHLEARLVWEDIGGTEVSPANGATFLAPDEDVEVYLVATRRVELERVVTRYYLDGALVGEAEEAVGSVGGATTGTTSVGMAWDGAAWADFFDGIMDELRVVDYELSPEEVRATWDRMTVHQPNAVAAASSSMPPGSRWGSDPSTRWGKLVRVAGEVVGQGLSQLEELRQNWLPDRAYLGWIERWENLLAASPGPRDSLDVRRGRVVDLLRRSNGFANPQIQDALEEAFDLDAADIELIEFSNQITDDFTTIEEARWMVDGDWVGDGSLAVNLSDGGSAQWPAPGGYERVWCVTPLSSGRGRLVLQAKIDSYAGNIPSTATVGLFLMNRVSKNALWFGVKNDGGTNKLGYVKNVDGVLSAFTVIQNPAPAEPMWLRIMRAPTTKASEDGASTTYSLDWSTTNGVTGFTETVVADLLDDPEWGGFGVHSTASWGASAGLGCEFDDLVLITPRGTRPFHWYAYRDPGLPGSPNMARAHALVLRYRPAHTEAAAIASLEVLCDDPLLGLCDHGPCGGI